MISEIYIIAFIAGSAFPVVIWPFMYLGLSYTYLNSSSSFKIGLLPIILPFIFGFANVFYMFLELIYPAQSFIRIWLFGGMFGLILSLIGNFVYNIPKDLFRLKGKVQYLTLIFFPIFYSLIWRYIIFNLNKLLNIL